MAIAEIPLPTRPASPVREATIEDLYEIKEKAEIVNGRVVRFMATGGMPGFAGDEITFALQMYVRRVRRGVAVGDNKGFAVDLPSRKSFSPDAAFYVGTNPGMKFYQGAPVFAVEVRSENDYGEQAERDMAQKRADYFAAGTKVVWDVDLLRPDAVVKKYTAAAPDVPVGFARGEIADALPALPDWELPVDDLFAPAQTA